MTREQIDQMVDDELLPKGLLCADGHDDAIIGVSASDKFGRPVCVIYSQNQIIENLMNGGCTFEEAIEHFDFNIRGAWVGVHTPMYILTAPE